GSGEDQRAHGRTLAQRSDPSTFAPTPEHAYRYLRSLADANRQRERRSASRHRRRRAASRTTDHVSTATMKTKTRPLIAAPPRKLGGRAVRRRPPEEPASACAGCRSGSA